MGVSRVLDKYYLDFTLDCISRGLCLGDGENNCVRNERKISPGGNSDKLYIRFLSVRIAEVKDIFFRPEQNPKISVKQDETLYG